jgi:hypothetical protein
MHLTMNEQFNRRGFNKLTAAAISGLATGATIGCGTAKNSPAAKGEATVARADVHLCRGLNECKGQGKDGLNACRGLGTCATAKEHSCGGQNECKGLGGCGEAVGKNDCKGQGGCHVPLMESAWETLRQRKEGEWAEKKLEVGTPPAKAG